MRSGAGAAGAAVARVLATLTRAAANTARRSTSRTFDVGKWGSAAAKAREPFLAEGDHRLANIGRGEALLDVLEFALKTRKAACGGDSIYVKKLIRILGMSLEEARKTEAAIIAKEKPRCS